MWNTIRKNEVRSKEGKVGGKGQEKWGEKRREKKGGQMKGNK